MICNIKYALLIATTVFCSAVFAQEETKPEPSAEDLAKKLANPLASLISVPLQNNTDYGIGADKGVKNTLNFQPVVPFQLSPKLNLITRYVLPIVTQYNIYEQGVSQSGLSDATMSAFFSPVGSKIIWGAGPAFLIPIATNDLLGTKKFCVGPTALAAKQTASGWTYGALFNQLWSVAGDKNRADVSQLFFQPFVVHNWKSGAGIAGSFEFTQNWNADKDALSGTFIPYVSAVTRLGKQAVSIVVGPRIPLAGSEQGKADWGWRASLTFVIPK